MDPVSVLQVAGFAASAARGAIDVSKDLYIFYKDVKHVDQNVAGLDAEIQALGSACSLVDQRLQEIVEEHDTALASGGPTRARIWDCVKLQVTDSRKTIDQLRFALCDVRGQGNSGVLNQVWRQIKLNTKTKDIGEARSRIRSHTASLQTVLQTIAIELSHKGDQQLRTLLTKAEECIDRLKALQATSTDEDVEQKAREDEIIKIGEATVTVAHESIYGASVANYSVIGDPTSKSSHVHGWLQDITAIEKTKTDLEAITESDWRSTISDEPSACFTEDNRRMSTAATSTVPNDHPRDTSTSLADHSNDEDDSEHELLIDAAKDALKTAESCFKDADYTEASEELREALKIILELPTQEQAKVCDTWEIRYLLSVCAYHTESLEDAKSQLRIVVDYALRESLRTCQQRKQCCEAGHLLSVVCVKLGDLEEARQYCQSTYEARKKLCGKSHHDTYQSLALWARIVHLQGNARRAAIYYRQIPEDERPVYVKNVEDLAPEPGRSIRQPVDFPTTTPNISLMPNDRQEATQSHESRQRHNQDYTRPPIDTKDSTDSGISLGCDTLAQSTSVTTSPRSVTNSEPSTWRQPTSHVPTMRNQPIRRTNEYDQDTRTARGETPSSPASWQNELTKAFTGNFSLNTEPEHRLSPERIKDSQSNYTNSTAMVTQPDARGMVAGPLVKTDVSPQPASTPPAQGHLASRPRTSKGSSSIDHRTSLAPSVFDTDEYLLSQIENLPDRREICALLPQMRSVANMLADIRRQAHVAEQDRLVPVPRDCISEFEKAERALAAARKHAPSAYRAFVKFEVPKAEASALLAAKHLNKHIATPQDHTVLPEPVIAKRGTFSRLRGTGSSEKAPQDITIQTSQGAIKVRIWDDSKPGRQLISRAHGGSFVSKELYLAPKGLKAVNGDQTLLITPAPTRVLDEKSNLIGYVVEGFELLGEPLASENPPVLRILECRVG